MLRALSCSHCPSCAAGEMANPEDIELGDGDEMEEDGDEGADAGEGLQVKQKAVPDAVFGASGLQASAGSEDEPQGARERLKKRRTG